MKVDEAETRRAWRPDEVATMAGMTPQHIRRLCAAGVIKAIDVGLGSRHKWLIPAAALDEFLASQNEAS